MSWYKFTLILSGYLQQQSQQWLLYRQFMGLHYLIFDDYLRLRFLAVLKNSGLLRPVPVLCRVFCSNLWTDMNLNCLTMASARYGILLCSYCWLRSQICITCQRCWFPDLVAMSCCAGAGYLGPDRDRGIRTRWIRSSSPTKIRVWLR